jgi:anti-sigma B factor antagonist
MESFRIGMEWSGDAVHLRVRGELDIAVADELVERVAALASSSARLTLVDLSEVMFIDSSGLRALIEAHRIGEGARDFEVIVVRPRQSVRRVIDITGAGRILRLVDAPDADAPAPAA